MDDEIRQLERQLEAATAPADTESPLLDAETSSLREGWLALGQLLEAADGSRGEPLVPYRAPQPRRVGRHRMSTVVALAASLLALATTAWLVLRPEAADQPIPGPGAVAVGTQQPVQPEEPATPEFATVVAESKFAWDDSLDDQLVSAAQAVVSVQGDWAASGRSIDCLRYGLEQVQADFDSGSL